MSRATTVSTQAMRISFVCTGNICRSPLAEALARHYLDKAGYGDWFEVDSFGTHDYHVGLGADQRTIATAAAFGIDLTGHRARQVSAADVADAGLVFAMDSGHHTFLQRLLPAAEQENLHLFLPWTGAAAPVDVPDPYYGELDGFVAVHRLLDDAMQRLVQRFTIMLGMDHG